MGSQRQWWQGLRLWLVGLGLSLSLGCVASVPGSIAADPAPAPPAIVTSPPPPTPTLPPATTRVLSRAPHLVNPPRGDVRLAVISDLNGAYGSTDYAAEVDQAIALMPFWQPDVVLCSGDMIAGQNSSLTTAEIQAMWAAFDAHVAAPLRQAQIPFGFTIGNHDGSGARNRDRSFRFQTERHLATAYWQNPAHDPGLNFSDRQDFPFYYTFQTQDIFVLVWDGSTSQLPPEKLAWVEQMLASPAAQSARLRLLLSHLPLYAVAEGRNQPGEVMNQADELRSLLEKYGVHTYISGHHHAYYPGQRGQLQLLHTGLLGGGPRPLLGQSQPAPKTVTIIDIDFHTPDLTTYTTYDMATLTVLNPATLPRLLLGHNGMVLRRDVPWSALTAAEKATCTQRLGADRCTA